MTNKVKPTVKKPNPVNLIRHVNIYDAAFKKAVILYAEKKSNSEAKRRYGIHESSIRRWRKLKADIMEKAKKSSKRPKKISPAVGTNAVSKKLDSMPLELRLKGPTPSTSSLHSSASEQEPDILHSHALSPTKLKVTRQSTKPSQVSPKPATSPALVSEDVCLKWSGHHTNMQSAFPHLLLKEQYVDATLVAEGQSLKCHRVILSSCSPYFEDVLSGIGPFQHPILFMKDVPFWILKAMCDFMYAGEVRVAPDKLQEYLAVAKSLKLKGIEGDEPVVPTIFIKSEPGTTPERKSEPKHVREKSREIKETKEKVKEVKEQKEKVKETREKMKEVKEREKEVKQQIKDLKETRDRRKYHLPSPPKEMPLLKSAKATKVVPPQPDVEMPVLKSSKIARPTYASRRAEKKMDRSEPKIEMSDNPPDTSNIYDPLGLLQAVYEEPTRNDVQEIKSAPVKKAVPKKLKKRKISDDREEWVSFQSPPPVLSRKGTRSRPNRKIPKFYHPAYDRPAKRREPEEGTIIREPHTDQADPLMELENIKSEPLDMIEDSIDIEDNVIEYDHHELLLAEISDVPDTFVSPTYPSKLRGIKKIKKSPILEQPVITSDSVEMADIRDDVENNVLLSEDPLNFSPNSTGLTIANVESVMEKEDSMGICTNLGFCISSVMTATDDVNKDNETGSNDLKYAKTAEDKLLLKISNVVGETFDSIAIKKEVETDGDLGGGDGHTRRICVRKDLEENILEFEFMDNSEELDEKQIDASMNVDEAVHMNIQSGDSESLLMEREHASHEVAHENNENIACSNLEQVENTDAEVHNDTGQGHIETSTIEGASIAESTGHPELLETSITSDTQSHCEEGKDPPGQICSLEKPEEPIESPMDVSEAETDRLDVDVNNVTEIENESAVKSNSKQTEVSGTGEEKNRSFASEEIMINEMRLMDESYPELPDDDLDIPAADGTSNKPSDEEPVVLHHPIETIHNDGQFNHLKRISATGEDSISIYNPSYMDTSLSDRDPLGEMEYNENNADIPPSERMWSGNTTENIPPALSEHNSYDFESESGPECTERLHTETTPITENIDSNEFSINDLGNDKNLEHDSIESRVSVRNPSELFFNSNQEKTSSPYHESNDLVVTPPNLVDYTHSSVAFNQTTFHGAQAATKQITANRLTDSIEQPMRTEDTSQTTGLSNDLESIVNDLTMIVESSRGNRPVEICDDASVIDSLENLLEK